MATTRGGVDRTQLEVLVDRDLTVREIAAELDRSYSTVRHWLRRYGLRTTDRARRRPPDDLMELVCERHGPATYVRAGRRVVCVRCRAEAVTRWRRRAKKVLVAEAGGSCALCGYHRCSGALHFHHREPAKKLFGIAGRGLGRSMATLRTEAAKCVLLCSNCHAEVEAGIATIP